MDDTKKDYTTLGNNPDESQLQNCRPYLIQKMKQEKLKKDEIQAIAQDFEPDLSILPEEIQAIVSRARNRHGNELTSKQCDRMLLE